MRVIRPLLLMQRNSKVTYQQDLNNCDNGILTQLLTFRILSIVLFFIQKQRFGDWTLAPSLGKSPLSWAQSIELVSISVSVWPNR
jgi:hypothetical protein